MVWYSIIAETFSLPNTVHEEYDKISLKLSDKWNIKSYSLHK